jgi:predicted nucleic acid-binding protein
MSDASAFVDTNVIVYLFDGRTPAKQRRSGELLSDLARSRSPPVVSTQVLQEAYSALTRKLQIDPVDALAMLREAGDSTFRVIAVDVALIWLGAQRAIDDRLAFWDGLIVAAAMQAECDVLYSEDMQPGRRFGTLEVRNPYA